jgi:hypothetical protein
MYYQIVLTKKTYDLLHLFYIIYYNFKISILNYLIHHINSTNVTQAITDHLHFLLSKNQMKITLKHK